MYYNGYGDLKLSALGFGAMRLPVKNGNDAEIDEEEALKLVDEAYKAGINYFDTAWGYHAGNSEIVMGKALKRYPRESFFLSTKFPGYDVSNFGKVEEIFEKQLEKCQTEYFDFYFLHNVTELNIDRYLDDDRYHTFSYLMEQKREGRIRHLGFSCHGSLETMRRFLEKYGDSMEFGMIQLNYLDYEFQDAREKIGILRSRNIPIWVMEPLRGGLLAKLPEDGMKELEGLRPGVKPVEWAFRFLQSILNVTMILSGMSEMSQMMENIRVFDRREPLEENEVETLKRIAKGMVSGKIVPCTSCKYCLAHCPKALDIPSFMSHYNETSFTGGGFISAMYIMSLPEDKRPSACVGCESCEKVCPQGIRISEKIEELDAMTAGTVKAMSGGRRGPRRRDSVRTSGPFQKRSEAPLPGMLRDGQGAVRLQDGRGERCGRSIQPRGLQIMTIGMNVCIGGGFQGIGEAMHAVRSADAGGSGRKKDSRILESVSRCIKDSVADARAHGNGKGSRRSIGSTCLFLRIRRSSCFPWSSL